MKNHAGIRAWAPVAATTLFLGLTASLSAIPITTYREVDESASVRVLRDWSDREASRKVGVAFDASPRFDFSHATKSGGARSWNSQRDWPSWLEKKVEQFDARKDRKHLRKNDVPDAGVESLVVLTTLSTASLADDSPVSVPDGGSTATMLGGVLAALALWGRKRKV